jgi:hypothetical protein
MFIFWTGQGYLVCLATIVSFVATKYVTDVTGILPEFGAALGAWAAAALVYKLHTLLTDTSTGLTVVDDETGESAPLLAKHDLYWIPVKYWSMILAAAGLWFTYLSIQTLIIGA